MALRKLFGKDMDMEGLPAELRGLLEDMRKERSAFEAAVVRGTEAQKLAEDLGARVVQAQQQVGPLAARLTELEGQATQIAQVQKTVEAVAAGARDAGAQLTETQRIVTMTRTELDALRGMLQEALAMKQDVAGALAEQARLAAQQREMAERATEVRAGHDRVQQGSEEAARRLAAMEARFEGIGAGVSSFVERADGFERTAEELRRLLTDLPNVRRELGTLHAMADVVSQKTAAVEGQRDAVERATKGAERLAELVGQVDRQLQEQQRNLGFLDQLEQQVRELKQLHGTLLERTEEVQKGQRAIDAEIRAQRTSFDEARETVQDAIAGFAFERDGLAAMSQRVEHLRGTLAGVEQQLPALEAVKTSLERTETTTTQLAARVASVAEEVQGIETVAATLAGLREEAHAVAATARELLARTEALGRPAAQSLDETERRVADLSAAVEGLERRAALLDGHRTAVAEMNRELTTRQGELDAALAQLGRTTELRDEASRMVDQLERKAGRLQEKLEAATEAAERADRQLEDLGERSRRVEEVGAKVERFERRFAALLGAEDAIERALARAAERQAAADAMRDDIARLFGVADSTAAQVRAIVALQKEVEQRRTSLEEVTTKLRDLERLGERVDERAHQFQEAEQRLAQLDAVVAGLQTTLETALAQKDFLDKVIETAGALSFQTMQAEGVLTQLRQEQERSESGGKKPGRK